MYCTTSLKFCKCGFHTEVRFRKPGIGSPSVFSMKCKGCESEYLVKMTGKPSMGTQVKSQHRLVKTSPDLKAILDEEAKLAKEEQDAALATYPKYPEETR